MSREEERGNVFSTNRPYSCSSVAFFLFVVLWLCGAPAWSGPLDDALRLQERALQDQEQRLRELERKHREILDSPPQGTASRLPEAEVDLPGAPCLETRSISFSGATRLGTRELQALAAPYVGRCLGLKDVDNLLRAVTNAYVDRGYVTTRAMVSPRGHAQGRLDILVVEGRVESIESADRGPGALELKTAFPGVAGDVLNLRDIEQGLDQMSRLPSNNATLELVPGETPGTTRIRISNQKGRAWRASAGLDNSGQDATGRDQYSLNFSKDNLLGLNDLLTLSAGGDTDGLRGHRQRSSSYYALYSVPWGWWTFTASLGFSDYASTVSGSGLDYSTEGDTTTAALDIDRVIHRDGVSKTALGFSLSRRETRNFLEDQKLDVSSRTLSVLGMSLNHSRRLAGGVASGHLEWSQGLPVLGAGRADNPEGDEPRNEFGKLSLSGAFHRPFSLGGANLTWKTQANGQWSPHTLPGEERIGIGSRSTVRGFHEDSLSGDIGAYIRNELALNIFDAAGAPSALSGWVESVELYAGYDAGFIWRDDKEDEERGEVQGGTAGGRSTGGSLITDIAGSHALDAPSFLERDGLEVYATFTYAF
jgi:hemolysin activation/secretion protein